MLRLSFGNVCEDNIKTGVSRLRRALDRELEGAGSEPAARRALATLPAV